jgi:hypothetical protein
MMEESAVPCYDDLMNSSSLERLVEVWPLLDAKQQATLLALAEIAANEAQLGKSLGKRFTQAMNIALSPEKCVHIDW